MANRSKLVAIALPLVAAASLAVVLVLLCSTTGSSEDGYLGRVGMPWGGTVTVLPFSPTDVLPLLPRSVAMAALRALRGVSDIFPVFVGAASAGGPDSVPGSAGGMVSWKGACFYENEAWLVFHNETGSKYGGGTLHIKASLHPCTIDGCTARLRPARLNLAPGKPEAPSSPVQLFGCSCCSVPCCCSERRNEES